MKIVTLTGAGISFALILVIMLPQNFNLMQTQLSIHCILAILLRHFAVLFVLFYPKYLAFSWMASAIFLYSCVVYSLQPVNRVTACLNDITKPTYEQLRLFVQH